MCNPLTIISRSEKVAVAVGMNFDRSNQERSNVSFVQGRINHLNNTTLDQNHTASPGSVVPAQEDVGQEHGDDHEHEEDRAEQRGGAVASGVSQRHSQPTPDETHYNY